MVYVLLLKNDYICYYYRIVKPLNQWNLIRLKEQVAERAESGNNNIDSVDLKCRIKWRSHRKYFFHNLNMNGKISPRNDICFSFCVRLIYYYNINISTFGNIYREIITPIISNVTLSFKIISFLKIRTRFFLFYLYQKYG